MRHQLGWHPRSPKVDEVADQIVHLTSLRAGLLLLAIRQTWPAALKLSRSRQGLRKNAFQTYRHVPLPNCARWRRNQCGESAVNLGKLSREQLQAASLIWTL